MRQAEKILGGTKGKTTNLQNIEDQGEPQEKTRGQSTYHHHLYFQVLLMDSMRTFR
jgi:hypothetical protein